MAGLWLLAAWVALAGCHSGGQPNVPGSDPPGGWHYDISVSGDLQQMQVRMCFEGTPPEAVVAGTDRTLDHLLYVRSEAGTQPRRRGDTLVLTNQPPGACIRYGLALRDLAGDDPFQGGVALPDKVMAKPSLWLLRPPERPPHAKVTLAFHLPQGVRVSAPWPLVEGEGREDPNAVFALPESSFRWLAWVVFGDFEPVRFAVGETTMEVVLLDPRVRFTHDGVRRWLTDAAQGVMTVYGEFPREHVQTVVVPVQLTHRAFAFGLAMRGGGAGVSIVANANAVDEDLTGNWTTVHELFHHGMPYVRDPWLAEGVPTYYQEVALTRQGHRSEVEGWTELVAGFDAGRRQPWGELTLQEVSDNWLGYQRAYWGGAALAFLLDVEIREDSGGRRGLDDAVRELRRCCGDAQHRWPAERLLSHLDFWYGKPLFTETAAAYLERPGFPPVEQALARLGITVEHGELMIDPNHPGAALRQSIMAPRTGHRLATGDYRVPGAWLGP